MTTTTFTTRQATQAELETLEATLGQNYPFFAVEAHDTTDLMETECGTLSLQGEVILTYQVVRGNKKLFAAVWADGEPLTYNPMLQISRTDALATLINF